MVVQTAGGQRVAFFGGSFDPPHLGHLAIARAAREALRLDQVLFAPVGAQPLKPQGSTAPFEDRVKMTELAIAGEPGFAVCLLDAPDPKGKPNYTLETLERLRLALPPDSQLFCLMGADSFLALRHWHRAAEVPFAGALVVASRPGQMLDDLASALPAGLVLCPGAAPTGESMRPEGGGVRVSTYAVCDRDGRSAPFYLLPELDVEISASAIREQVSATGRGERAYRDLVPPAVGNYIRSHGIYC